MRLTQAMRTTIVLRRSLCCWLLTMFAFLQQSDMSIAQTEAEQDQYAAIEIIRVQHRDATPIRTALMSVLDPRGSIGLIDNNLIVASTRANLRELRTLIQQLDLPRQSLLISINFDFTNSVSEHVQSVQVLEGDTVIIQEQQLPNPDLLNETAANTDIDSGQQVLMAFSTRAEIRGSMIYVTLQDARPAADQAVDSQVLTTTVTPGQWVLINPLVLTGPVIEDDFFSDAASDFLSDAGSNAASGAAVVPRQLAVQVELLP